MVVILYMLKGQRTNYALEGHEGNGAEKAGIGDRFLKYFPMGLWNMQIGDVILKSNKLFNVSKNENKAAHIDLNMAI